MWAVFTWNGHWPFAGSVVINLYVKISQLRTSPEDTKPFDGTFQCNLLWQPGSAKKNIQACTWHTCMHRLFEEKLCLLAKKHCHFPQPIFILSLKSFRAIFTWNGQCVSLTGRIGTVINLYAWRCRKLTAIINEWDSPQLSPVYAPIKTLYTGAICSKCPIENTIKGGAWQWPTEMKG